MCMYVNGACVIVCVCHADTDGSHGMAGSRTALSPAQLEGLMQRVLLQHPANSEQLLRCLYGLPSAVASLRVALVVLDSVAALVRTTNDVASNSKVRALSSRQGMSCYWNGLGLTARCFHYAFLFGAPSCEPPTT